ncbi:acyltransferase family protein [Fimbriiglobus ruber]|uniref:Acyltransferase n=1 Tax=Fimbriiglobus ruber TaxID=1908690 RepID=A0A225DQ54_9BACT|nr:acyltransferase [Fimbriiglobus ruber]OWK38525.1 Acyltransferase [Fimbriiglobus ruber]
MDRRNNGLDVLRTLAIVAVVNCHVYNTFAPGGANVTRFGFGGRGVDLFFVLSGWLLGHQLLTERAKTGTIDVRRFWLRRAFRIFPAYFFVLFLTMGQQVWKHGLGAIDPIYFVFGQNYYNKTPYFGISWSLCVEEHFYLLIGPVLLLAARSTAAAWLVAGLLAVPTVCRACGWYWTDGLFDTHVRYDQCAAGVVLAWVCVSRPRLWQWLAGAAPWLALAGAAGVGALVANKWVPEELQNPTLEAGFWTSVFAAWVLFAATSTVRLPGLLTRVTRFVAERAFALYLVHVDAIRVAVRVVDYARENREFATDHGDLLLVVTFVLVWALALGVAEVLYRLIERPFMGLRDRFAATRSRRAGATARPEPVVLADRTRVTEPAPVG